MQRPLYSTGVAKWMHYYPIMTERQFQPLRSILRIELQYINNYFKHTFWECEALNHAKVEQQSITTIFTFACVNLISLTRHKIAFTKVSKILLAIARFVCSRVWVSLRVLPSLSCLCPDSTDLVHWSKLNKSETFIYGNCWDGTADSDYSMTPCLTQPATADGKKQNTVTPLITYLNLVQTNRPSLVGQTATTHSNASAHAFCHFILTDTCVSYYLRCLCRNSIKPLSPTRTAQMNRY